MKNIITFLAINLLMLSCANTSLQPDTYERDAAQRVSNVLYGEIVSLKQVKIEGDTKSGTIVGGLVGAAAGSGVSDSKPESEIGAVLGGAIGATLGGNLSKNIRAVDGVQLTINMDDGRTISLVQEVGGYNFSIGDLVEVISIKGKTRVSPSGVK
tara:strand:+ start:342 stop:806 length:465 start_codon:yes stop_codon:yes gene_type:complete